MGVGRDNRQCWVLVSGGSRTQKDPKVCTIPDCKNFLTDLRCRSGQVIMGQAIRYFVCVTQHGRSNGRFGWEICREDNSLVVERSTNTFSTQVQALVASAKAASCLAFSSDRQSLQPASAGKACRQKRARVSEVVGAIEELEGTGF
jgi:hypothetical protein